jgi:spore germination cell wall hydrolase CwlJ-like protein
MARLAYAKGTSYSHKDKRAVVSVVMNRALFNPKGTYPGTVCGVIKEKNAFSAVSQSNRKWRESLEPPHINMRTLPEVKEWNLSATAALKASKKPLPELEGATIFHSNSKIGKRPINGQHSPKYWICKFATKIGGHYYFKLLKKN